MTTINLKDEGGTKLVQFENQYFNGYHPQDTIPASDLKLGDFGDAGTVIRANNNTEAIILMTRKQYDNIVTFKGETTTYDADTDIVFPETNAQLKADINNLGNHHIDFLERFAALEKQAGAIEFDEWSMKGTILTGKLGTRNVCRINLSGDFDIDQVEYNDVAEDDGQRLLTISKNGVTRKFHTFTSNDLSAITDQAMNPQPGTIVSNVPKPKT